MKKFTESINKDLSYGELIDIFLELEDADFKVDISNHVGKMFYLTGADMKFIDESSKLGYKFTVDVEFNHTKDTLELLNVFFNTFVNIRRRLNFFGYELSNIDYNVQNFHMPYKLSSITIHIKNIS